MPVYTIETPSGKQLDIEADDEATAIRGAQEWHNAQPTGQRGAGGVLNDALNRTFGQTDAQVADAVAKTRGVEPTPMIDALKRIFDYSVASTAYAAREARRGVAMTAGLPVDLVNLGLHAAGAPTSDKPIGGSKFIDSALGGFGLIPEPPGKPDVFQRVGGRIAMEAGANVLPVAGVVAKGMRMGAPAARALANTPYQEGVSFLRQPATMAKRAAGRALEAGAVDPGGLAAREAGFAVAAGTGAGIANEAARNPQHGDNFASDFTGSLLGVLGHSVAGAAGGAARNLGAAALGRPEMMNDLAREEAANRIINNSSTMQRQFAETGAVDTSPLVEQLRTPAPVENAVPGYVANIADRAQDPGLTAFAFNTDALMPGAAAARRAGNETAVEQRLQGLAPEGDAGQFRSSLENARTQQIGDAQSRVDQALAAYNSAVRDVQPGMPDAAARGSSLRAALQNASDAVRAQVAQLWAPINTARTQVDVSPLVEQFNRVDQGLSQNELRRFQPAEAAIPQRMVEPATEADASGLLDASGAPIMRPGEPASGMQPLNEITGIRAGLSDSLLAAPAGSNEQRILRQYIEALDQFVERSVPEELRGQYGAAREATRNFKDRFTRPGDGVAQTLQRREGGDYQLDPSALAPKFAPTDQGRVSDFRALMREAGADPRARNAVADQVLTDARAAGALDNPQAMSEFLAQRSIVLGEMPEVRNRLQNAGFSRAMLDDAERTAAETTKRLMTPGRSATASYLKYGDERTVDAIRTVTNAGEPAKAARDLLAQVGSTPEARAGLRDAFWRDVEQSGKDSAATASGNTKWNGRKLRAFLDDPKRAAVAEELWSDQPEQLAQIRQVFEALATAEGSSRARTPGSSGTAQALNGKFDASLSMASLASRGRSVSRGVLSPQVAIIDIVSTYLRNKKVQVQQRAIDSMASAVVNQPELAAELLQRYNPADLPARRRLLTQKYGVRGTQIGNWLDEAQNEDKTVRAVRGD